MKKWYIVLGLLVIILLATSLTRFRIEADVFNLLPVDSPMVHGLKLFQKSFGSSQAIIISVRSSDADSSLHATENLAQRLQDAGLAEQVIWRSPFHNNPQALAEFLAYLWFNQPPDEFKAMAHRFDNENLQGALELTIERMSTSYNPQEVARLANDPFLLTSIGDTISTSLIDIGKNPFASQDGRMRILYVPFFGDTPGFWQYRDWLGDINKLIAEWQQSDGVARHATVRVTGNPVFITEFGSRLLRDMSLAAGGTLIVIAGLFWWVHRRLTPLLWLVTLLILTIVITMALGGLIFGALNAVSLGFAAILMGLAVDYALILYQERRIHPGRSSGELRRIMAPSILWAAVTTAGAFTMVSRSSLPGLTQLGLLVAIGIITAAVLMLFVYVALLGRTDLKAKEDLRTQYEAGSDSVQSMIGSNKRFVWSVTSLMILLSVLLLSFRGPDIKTGVESLQFENVKAQTTLEEIQQEITGYGSELWLIISGADEGQVNMRLDNAQDVLAQAKQNGVLTRVALPFGLWPQVDAQQANREVASVLMTRQSAVEEEVVAAGFTPESLTLTKAMFVSWQQFIDTDTVAWPKQPASRWLFNQFAADNDEQILALGQVEVSSQVSRAQLETLAHQLAVADGGLLVGWSLLADSLVEIIKQDVIRVVLPMVIALVVLLGFAYRDVREILLSFATLGFTMICLFAAMGALEWSWNLMNMTALPLLLGAGVDYSIHIQLALKRYSGNFNQVKRSVGNAILLCGASTAAAFASLGFASNPGLASLGKVAALGIVIASLTAVFLLPMWWSTVQNYKRVVGE